MGFLKKRVTPLELLAHIVEMSNTMRPGIAKILDGIARQIDIGENEMHEESIFAIEIFMLINAIERSSYSREGKDIVIETCKDGMVTTVTEIGLDSDVFAEMLVRMSSQFKRCLR